MDLNCILCIDKNNGIAKNNQIPWKIKEDLRHFNTITSYTTNPLKLNVVVMGRKTYESIGKPLPNRINVVLSK